MIGITITATMRMITTITPNENTHLTMHVTINMHMAIHMAMDFVHD